MSIEDPGQADDTPATPELLSQNTTSQKTGLAEPGPPSQAVDEEAAGLSAELSLDNANVTKEKLCGVCNEKPSKYKCARCYLPYCSIVCSTLHKATHPAIEATSPHKSQSVAIAKVDNVIPRPVTVAAAGYKRLFEVLDNSKELQMLFKSYPRLAHQLDEINAATLPSMGGENSSTRSQNVRGKRQWNPDQGVDNGLKALQRARNGKDGEGVKEFSAFVIRLVSKGSTVDPDTLQKEKEEEDAQIVSQLLNGDL